VTINGAPSGEGPAAVRLARVADGAVLFLAQGFGTGRAPFAPGTLGTTPGLVFYLLLASLPLALYAGIVTLLTVVGIALCDRAARILGQDDPSSVVWDEIVGVMIALAGTPLSPWSLLAGFAAFRLFDIWKPGPVGWADRRLHGGLGIMLDDVLAGFAALAVLQLARVWDTPL
jgi:phosphatidylglycerophosphatase A